MPRKEEVAAFVPIPANTPDTETGAGDDAAPQGGYDMALPLAGEAGAPQAVTKTPSPVLQAAPELSSTACRMVDAAEMDTIELASAAAAMPSWARPVAPSGVPLMPGMVAGAACAPGGQHAGGPPLVRAGRP